MDYNIFSLIIGKNIFYNYTNLKYGLITLSKLILVESCYYISY